MSRDTKRPAQEQYAPAALIWERHEEQQRQRRPDLNRSRITEIATGIADEQGLESLSIRELATRLGVTPMALYRYVKNKDEVLELMVDAALAEQTTPLNPEDWENRLKRYAAEHRALLHRHPWLTELRSDRPFLGPQSLRLTENLLRLFVDAGLNVQQSQACLGVVNAFLYGFVAAELSEHVAQRRTGQTEQQWQQQLQPYIQRTVVEQQEFPLLTQIVTSPEEASPSSFLEALEIILLGLKARFTVLQDEPA